MTSTAPHRRVLPAVLAAATIALGAPGLAHASAPHGPHPAGPASTPLALAAESASARRGVDAAAVGTN